MPCEWDEQRSSIVLEQLECQLFAIFVLFAKRLHSVNVNGTDADAVNWIKYETAAEE